MPSRRKLNFAAIHAANAQPNRDDARPWFLVRFMPAPVHCEVHIAWADGNLSTGSWNGVRWRNDYWSSHRKTREDPPVGWKPLRFSAAGNVRGEALPDARRYGLEFV